MDGLYDFLKYLIIILALVLVSGGGIYLKHKFNIKDSEIELGKKIIGLMTYIIQKTDFKYKGDIQIVANYVLQAFDIVLKMDSIDLYESKKELILNKAMEICKANGINVDNELANTIDFIADYFLFN